MIKLLAVLLLAGMLIGWLLVWVKRKWFPEQKSGKRRYGE